MEIKKINLNKNSKDILGQKLLRGCQIVNPFYSHVVEGYVGNIRTALTYLSRENVDKKLVSKPRLNKQELNVLVSLPKKKIADYDGLVKTLLSERIRNDEIIIQELKSLYCKDKKYFAVMFVAEDENGRPFEDMARYCKLLNRLMIDPMLVNFVLDLSTKKYNKKVITSRDIESKVKTKSIKPFNKSRPFAKRETSNRDVKRTTEPVTKERVVKNFKKDLPYTQKRLERS